MHWVQYVDASKRMWHACVLSLLSLLLLLLLGFLLKGILVEPAWRPSGLDFPSFWGYKTEAF